MHVKAFELSKNNKVLVRYNELKQEAAEDDYISITTLIKELDEAKEAALSAIMSKAKQS